MLMPIEGDLQQAYNNVNRAAEKRHGYSPLTPRMMGAWWQEESGHRLVYQEYSKQLCIEFDDHRDYTWFLLKWL